MFSLLTESERKLILFSYENRFSNQEITPIYFNKIEDQSFIFTQGEYILWELEKRKLDSPEIISHSWLIASQHKKPLLLNFKSDSRLTITSLFISERFEGQWYLENGILKAYFNYQEHSYSLDVIANNNRLIHSALQIIDDTSLDILKVIPISHAKYGNSLIE